MTELAVLQALRLKGRARAADLAATLGTDLTQTTEATEKLIATGLVIEGPTLRISPDGRVRLEKLLSEERKSVDAAALSAVYDEFRSVNGEFKALVTDWQLKGGVDGTPNTHDDVAYDDAVLARLDGVHQRVTPIVAAAVTQVPRLRSYQTKLDTALDKVKSGETTWLTRPLIDSYHTVWFELHEELILAIGLTREQAAKSGDAQ